MKRQTFSPEVCECAARLRNPELRCARAQRDDGLLAPIQRVWRSNMQIYGTDKVWRQMGREGATARQIAEWVFEIRTIGQARARFAMTMMAVCYDLKRLAYCQRAGIVHA
jgi:hypothetical protein